MSKVIWVSHYYWYHLIEVDTNKLADIARRQRAIKPEKLHPLIDKLEVGGEIDAPIISRGCRREVTFIDGIHRTLAAFHLGEPTIKIAVQPEEEDFIRQRLKSEA